MGYFDNLPPEYEDTENDEFSGGSEPGMSVYNDPPEDDGYVECPIEINGNCPECGSPSTCSHCHAEMDYDACPECGGKIAP